MMRATLLLGLSLALPAAAQQQTPVGRWLTQDGSGVVGVEPCGGALCGTVDGITGFQPNGDPPVDYLGRSRCHLTIIADLAPTQPGVWQGHITNPDDGRTYTIRITFDAKGRLQMRGFIGVPLLGRTTVWTRFTGRLLPDCHVAQG